MRHGKQNKPMDDDTPQPVAAQWFLASILRFSSSWLGRGARHLIVRPTHALAARFVCVPWRKALPIAIIPFLGQVEAFGVSVRRPITLSLLHSRPSATRLAWVDSASADAADVPLPRQAWLGKVTKHESRTRHSSATFGRRGIVWIIVHFVWLPRPLCLDRSQAQ